MDKLSLIKLFIAVAEAGSYAAAAQTLGLSPSTLSKGVSRLENHLNIRLFHRTTRQIQLSEAGGRYYESVVGMMGDLDELEGKLRESVDSPSGLLKVNAPIAFGRLYLMKLLPEFLSRYPNIRVDLSLDDTYVDMVEHGVDVSIRTGQLEDSRLVVRKLSPMDFVFCAAPSYLEKFGIPETIYELGNRAEECFALNEHRWIAFRFQQTGKLSSIRYFESNADGHLQQSHFLPEPYLIIDDGAAYVEAVEEGLGFAQMPHFCVYEGLKHGRLKQFGEIHRCARLSVYAYYLDRTFLPAKVRVFIDFLIEALGERGDSAESTFLDYCTFEELAVDKGTVDKGTVDKGAIDKMGIEKGTV